MFVGTYFFGIKTLLAPFAIIGFILGFILGLAAIYEGARGVLTKKLRAVGWMANGLKLEGRPAVFMGIFYIFIGLLLEIAFIFKGAMPILNSILGF